MATRYKIATQDRTETFTNKTLGSGCVNANLTGPITSTGNATAVASQTGTGTKFVMDTSPTLVTPALGTPASGDFQNCTGSTLTAKGVVELATAAEINTGTDTSRAMPVDQFVASNRNVRYFLIRVVDSATNWPVDGTTKVGGDVVIPFTGTIVDIAGYVDTAGTTGPGIVDVFLAHAGGAAATIMTTNKLSFDSTEKTTRTAVTTPTLTTTAVSAEDVITVNIVTNLTTKAKGLTVMLAIRQT